MLELMESSRIPAVAAALAGTPWQQERGEPWALLAAEPLVCVMGTVL